jgi:hypothetical protein
MPGSLRQSTNAKGEEWLEEKLKCKATRCMLCVLSWVD